MWPTPSCDSISAYSVSVMKHRNWISFSKQAWKHLWMKKVGVESWKHKYLELSIKLVCQHAVKRRLEESVTVLWFTNRTLASYQKQLSNLIKLLFIYGGRIHISCLHWGTNGIKVLWLFLLSAWKGRTKM